VSAQPEPEAEVAAIAVALAEALGKIEKLTRRVESLEDKSSAQSESLRQTQRSLAEAAVHLSRGPLDPVLRALRKAAGIET
jgi:chromosome segregation ATPase